MRGTKIYWLNQVWPGKLGISARPRGGDWLREELSDWRAEGIATVVSFLTAAEQRELGIEDEKAELGALGMKFINFPIFDRQVPDSVDRVAEVLNEVEKDLTGGRNVLFHCRQGVGRAGLAAACLLMTKGADAATAVAKLSEVRGVAIPETPEQRMWINDFAASSRRRGEQEPAPQAAPSGYVAKRR